MGALKAQDYHGQAEDLSQGSETNEVVPGWGGYSDEPMKRVSLNCFLGCHFDLRRSLFYCGDNSCCCRGTDSQSVR